VLLSPKDGEGAVTVIDLTGAGLKIPSWMLRSTASDFCLSSQPEIHLEALFRVAALVFRDEAGPEADSSSDGVNLSEKGDGPTKGGRREADATRARKRRAPDSNPLQGSRGIGETDGGRDCRRSQSTRRTKR